MTAALDVMVKAMRAEFDRQIEDDPDGSEPVDSLRQAVLADLDLEKVARAGLAAIREPDKATRTAGGEAQYWPRSLGGEATACVTEAAAVSAFKAMIDAISETK